MIKTKTEKQNLAKIFDEETHCYHDWESFKSDGFSIDTYVCRKCGKRIVFNKGGKK